MYSMNNILEEIAKNDKKVFKNFFDEHYLELVHYLKSASD